MSFSAEQAGQRAENSEWLDYAVRMGLVAYGVVHLMIAWLAIQLAVGGGGASANQKGALAELARQPFGKVLVWAIAIGMFLLVVWRALEAAFGHHERDNADRRKKQVASAAKGVVYAVLGITALKTATGASGASGGSNAMTAKVMNWPGGQVIVVVVGLAIIGYGGYMAYRGWSGKYAEHLDSEGRSGDTGKTYLMFGKVGYLAKGFSIAVVGGLFVYAGISHDPKRSGGLDQALHEVLRQPYGVVLLIAIGLGLGCYGLFCLARARHLSR
ncbi:MAG: DUF1206 domain-containing protein [Actinomycetota bacterium]|nr:DUF1206 domain-containing protein [Actinomycetota bacterium]